MQQAILQVRLINSQDQKIYDPLLILNYKARMATFIESQSSTDTIEFRSEYTMNTASF